MGFHCGAFPKKTDTERRFLDNGARLLQDLISSCDGKVNLFRIFSEEELRKATDHYDERRILDIDRILSGPHDLDSLDWHALNAICALLLCILFSLLRYTWPGSYCDTKRSCCYPTTGKPAADFGIHGLWPNYNDGSYPSNCDSESRFDPSEIKDLTGKMQTDWPTLACPSSNGIKFWSHEWQKHGTCSESVLNQHGYFQAALNLKKQANLLQILKDAGIEPDNRFYNLNSISTAIREATGYAPGIECNVDEDGNRQLFQIYMCVDTFGSNFIQCPVLPRSRCSSQKIQFPSFQGEEERTDGEL